ncbi:MAG: DUF3365 domain-containing protein [Verrucomicrobiota bacterium]
MRKISKKAITIVSMLGVVAGIVALSACGGSSGGGSGGYSPQTVTDYLFTVLKADRTIYARQVIQRLVNKEKVIGASENFMDEKKLPLPAQMFRMGSELVAENPDAGFTYSLQSLWPINKTNAAGQTPMEKEGLQYLVDNPGENFYGEEELGGKKYFTAIYPDSAVSPACVTCHNDHKDSPKTNFELGDVMGGVVIRIPLQ